MIRRLLALAVAGAAWSAPLAAQCGGVERWAVKSMADPGAQLVDLENRIPTTLHDLVRLPRPALPSDEVTRTSAERSVRTVDGRLVRFKEERGKHGDSDFHLVISDQTLLFTPSGASTPPSPHSFVAEIAHQGCVAGRHGTSPVPSRVAAQLDSVRRKFLERFPTITSGWNEAGGVPVRLTGVVFFDRPHGQVGRALNGIELHPLIGIEFDPQTPLVPLIAEGGGGAGGSPASLLVNPGFEDGAAGWTATAEVFGADGPVPARTGTGKAWLGGYGEAHTDRLSQRVTLPAQATAISLTFFLRIQTEEANQQAFDRLTLRVRNASGQFLGTLRTWTNLNASASWQLQSVDLTGFRGRTIRIELEAKEDNGSTTSFLLDDFAIVVEP